MVVTIIDFIVPITSKGRKWKCVSESYLVNNLLKSLVKTTKDDTDLQIRFTFGIDPEEPIYTPEAISKIFKKYSPMTCIDQHPNVIIYEKENKIEKSGHLTKMWNILAKYAVEVLKSKYLYQCGDDIVFIGNGGIGKCLRILKDEMKGFGAVGLICRRNPRILTQILVSAEHFKILGHFFPEELTNWFCDDWINELYKAFGRLKSLNDCFSDNMGGDERYKIDYNKVKFTEVLERDKIVIHNHLKELFNYS